MKKIKVILFGIVLLLTNYMGYSQSCDVVGEYFIQSKEEVIGEAFIWNDTNYIRIQLNLYSDDEDGGLDKTHLRIKADTQFEYDEFITTHYGSSQYTYIIPHNKGTVFTIDGSITLKNGYTYKFVTPETGRTTVMYRISKPCLIK